MWECIYKPLAKWIIAACELAMGNAMSVVFVQWYIPLPISRINLRMFLQIHSHTVYKFSQCTVRPMYCKQQVHSTQLSAHSAAATLQESGGCCWCCCCCCWRERERGRGGEGGSMLQLSRKVVAGAGVAAGRGGEGGNQPDWRLLGGSAQPNLRIGNVWWWNVSRNRKCFWWNVSTRKTDRGVHVDISDVRAKLLWIQRKQRIAKRYKKYRGLDNLDQSIGCWRSARWRICWEGTRW